MRKKRLLGFILMLVVNVCSPIDLGHICAAANPRIEIKNTWLGHNVTKNGVKGMNVYINFTIRGFKGGKGDLSVFIQNPKGTLLKKNDKAVSVNSKFNPKYDNTKYDKYTVFVPYSSIPVMTGAARSEYYCKIRFWDYTKKEWFPEVGYINFTLPTPSSNSGNSSDKNSNRPVKPFTNDVTSIVVKKTWLDHNVTKNGVKGMNIYIDFTIRGFKGGKGDLSVFIQNPKGTLLKKNDKAVSVNSKFNPKYDNTKYDKFTVFVPYSSIPVKTGSDRSEYYGKIRFWDYTKKEWFPEVGYINFTLPTSSSDSDNTSGNNSNRPVKPVTNDVTSDANSDHNFIHSCPDNRHPHAIDLGLPSGTKWACCNVGAKRPDERGDYYAWGETEPKKEFMRKNYSGNNINKDIIGTNYDVAHVKWGGKWQMPSMNQMYELFKYCNIVHHTPLSNEYGFNMNGRIFVSTENGRKIFFPNAGLYSEYGENGDYSDLFSAGQEGYYWSGTWNPDGAVEMHCPKHFGCGIHWEPRYKGFSVRPVGK